MLATAVPAMPMPVPVPTMRMPVATATTPPATTIPASTVPHPDAMSNTSIHRSSVPSSTSDLAPPSPLPQLHLSLLGLAPSPQPSPKRPTSAVASPASYPSDGVPTAHTTYAPAPAPGTAPAPVNVSHLLAQQVAALATARSASIASSILLFQLTCPVCGELLDQPVTLPCGHSACAMCLVPPSSRFRPMPLEGPNHSSHHTTNTFYPPPYQHETVPWPEAEVGGSSGYCATSSSPLTSSSASSQSCGSSTPEQASPAASPAESPTLRPSPLPARRHRKPASLTPFPLCSHPRYTRPVYRTKKAVLHARRDWVTPLVPLNASTVACPVETCSRSLVGQGVGTWAGRSVAYIPPSQQVYVPAQQQAQAEPDPDSGFWLDRADAALDLHLVGPIPSRRISRPRVHSAPPTRTRTTRLPPRTQITGVDSDSSSSPLAPSALNPSRPEGVMSTESIEAEATSAPESSTSSNADGMSPSPRTLESTWWYDPSSEHHDADSLPAAPSWHGPSQVATQAFQVDTVLSQLIDTLRAVPKPARSMMAGSTSQRSSTTTLVPSPPPSDATDPVPGGLHASKHPREDGSPLSNNHNMEVPDSPPTKRARLDPSSPAMDKDTHSDLPAPPTTLAGLKQAMLVLLRCPVRNAVLREPICLPCGHTICRSSVVAQAERSDTSLLCPCCSTPVSHKWVASHPPTHALWTVITSDFEVPLSEGRDPAQPAVRPIRPPSLQHGDDPAWSRFEQVVPLESEKRSRSYTLNVDTSQGTTDRTALTPAAQEAMFDAAGGHGTLGAQLLSGSLARTPSRFNLQTT